MPSCEPSASSMAMELKYAGPARSKKLMGRTTPSSRAMAPKCRTAGFSSTVRASFRCRASCSMQKYGVSNSSGSRMICAPRAAASRTSCSAFVMFAAASQPHDIWIVARVTGRGAWRKCSGCFDIGPSSRSAALGQRSANLLRDAHGGLQRHQTGFARDHRRAAVTDAGEKGLDLGLQGVSRVQTLLLDGDRQRAGRLPGSALADHCQNLLLQVQGQVRVVLEDAHLALGFQADTAGCRVDDASVGE